MILISWLEFILHCIFSCNCKIAKFNIKYINVFYSVYVRNPHWLLLRIWNCIPIQNKCMYFRKINSIRILMPFDGLNLRDIWIGIVNPANEESSSSCTNQNTRKRNIYLCPIMFSQSNNQILRRLYDGTIFETVSSWNILTAVILDARSFTLVAHSNNEIGKAITTIFINSFSK